MADKAPSSSSCAAWERPTEEGFGEDELLYGAESGWVEARTWCDHLASLSSDLLHIPTPDTPCNSSRHPMCNSELGSQRMRSPLRFFLISWRLTCHHPSENWLCLCCKDVLCSRFVNKHMLQHYQQTSDCLALSFSDLSVWCFSCDSYIDAQVLPQLRPVYETAYILKFGEPPPIRNVELQNVAASSGN